MQQLAIYPGTFDPITNGHIDIIKQAVKIFGRVVVAIAKETNKECLFTLEERVQLAKEVTKDLGNVEIEPFEGLAVDFARKKGSNVMIRGLRAVSDFEYELQLSLANRKLANEVKTIFLIPNIEYLYLSSSLIKQIINLGGNGKEYVPEIVYEAIRKKMGI